MELLPLIQSLAPVAYPAMREMYRADCCIAGAVILSRVFEQHGYQPEIVPVTVHVFNPQMMKLLSSGKPLPQDKAQRERLLDLTGAWSVGIVPPDPETVAYALSDRRNPKGIGYGGHLLVRVNQFLVDPTIRQAERPDKGITLPDMVYTRHADELMTEGKLYLDVNDCHVVYTRIADQSYKNAPDFKRRTTPYPETLKAILERSKALREGAA